MFVGCNGIDVQFRVVFILPTLTNKQIIAIVIAPALSAKSFSLRTLLVLLLRAMASM